MDKAFGHITLHTLLVGIDRYPPSYRSLYGCVNDIDALEELLLGEPGVGTPATQFRVTRLAAQHPHLPSISRFQAETSAPTKANVVAALQALAGSDVQPDDRVLIYYSGHGDEQRWEGSPVWHEALALHNGQKIEYLWDVEINHLIGAIAQRTNDLTVIFDCCHSAGATRGLTNADAESDVRSLNVESHPLPPPTLVAASNERGISGHILQSAEPNYLVAVACQSNEKAGEGVFGAEGIRHGVFSDSLRSLLAGLDPEQRAALRWADIWPELLEQANERSTRMGRGEQHPWLIGRSERRIFGGPWQKMDVGLALRQQADGSIAVAAGTQMGITVGAEIAIYGDEPRFFPAIDAPEDRPVGRLRISQADRSRATGTAVGAPFTLPQGARGRLVKAGENEKLRVCLQGENPALAALLEESAVLTLASASQAEVEVAPLPGGGWRVGSQTEALIATVPADEVDALRAGLEHYYRYNSVLRMAHNGVDMELRDSLRVEMLDCNDTEQLAALSAEALADPPLPDAPRNPDRSYSLPPEFKFCVRISNNSAYPLYVTLFNCSVGGLVEYMSDGLIRAGSPHVMWGATLGNPFETWPDELPDADPGFDLPATTIDRLIAIGTTRPDVDLKNLAVGKTVQVVIDEDLTRSRGVKQVGTKSTSGPVELWTAAIVPFHLPRQGSG